MAKMQVKPRPDKLGLRRVAILTFAAVLFSKAHRAACEQGSAEHEISATESPSPNCPDFCSLPPDTATRSKAPFHRWYYDPEEGTCRRFRWGGRGGNKNRFFKRSNCEEACSKCSLNDENPKTGLDTTEKDSVCSLSKDEGRCAKPDSGPSKPPQLLWYFDSDKGICTPFIFHGCGGNSNRFANKSDCEENCQ